MLPVSIARFKDLQAAKLNEEHRNASEVTIFTYRCCLGWNRRGICHTRRISADFVEVVEAGYNFGVEADLSE